LINGKQATLQQAVESSVGPAVENCRVLQLSAMGLSAVEVAAAIKLRTETVREDIADAIVALSVRSKLEAVVIALQLGLIELPSVRQSPSAQRAWSTTSSWSCLR
jgi:DNA-binding NarL/FixJ family response regulator